MSRMCLFSIFFYINFPRTCILLCSFYLHCRHLVDIQCIHKWGPNKWATSVSLVVALSCLHAIFPAVYVTCDNKPIWVELSWVESHVFYSPTLLCHDDVIKWKHFPRHWPFVFPGHRWIPLTKAGEAELWCFLWSTPEQKFEQTIETRWFETPSRPLWGHSNGISRKCNYVNIVFIYFFQLDSLFGAQEKSMWNQLPQLDVIMSLGNG